MVTLSPIDDTELALLENIFASRNTGNSLRQRDMANIVGASLGMTNAILKRLVQKGWIIVRKLNRRNIVYAVTPDGVNEIARRSYRYFKRTIRNIVFYRERIEHEIEQAKREQLSVVVLVGVSDLDFIVEHACTRHGLSFFHSTDQGTALKIMQASNVFCIYAETIPSTDASDKTLYLSSILTGNEAHNEHYV